MDSKQSIIITATEYICQTPEILESILEQVREQTSRNITDFLQITLEIDTQLILTKHKELGNALINSYNQTVRDLREIIFSLLTSNEFASLVKPEQISLNLSYISIPDSCTSSSIHGMVRKVRIGNIIQVIGQVVSIGEITKFVAVTTYSCRGKNCSNSNSPVFRHFEVGFSESNVFRREMSCDVCRGVLLEDVSKRVMCQKQKLKVKLIRKEIGTIKEIRAMDVSENIFQESTNSVPSQSLRGKSSDSKPKDAISIHPISLILRGKQVSKVELGRTYHFVGQPVYGRADYSSQFVSLPLSIEVNNLWNETKCSLGLDRDNLPLDLVQLKQACEYSEWSFVASLAFSIASEVCHPTIFCSVKLATLFSLVGGQCGTNNRHKGSIHLLVITQEHSLVARILGYGLRMCPRGGISGGGVQCEIGAVFQKEGVAAGDLVGGVLPLASDGVCFMPHFDSFKKDEKEKIQKALDTGLVPVKVAKGLSNEDKQIATPSVAQIPLSATIWICSEKVPTHLKVSKSILSQGTIQKYCHKAFTDLFTFAFTTLDDESIDEVQSDLILEQAMGVKNESLIERCDLVKWLEAASRIHTEVTEECSELINNFYLASRRVRQSDANSCQISVLSLEALVSLSVASAKLNLRKQVLKCDAVIAIVLFEESMVSRFGYSVIGTKNNLFGWSPGCAMSEMIGKQFDARMKMLAQQIDTFCNTHGPRGRES